MKHLKKFESIEDNPQIGDYVICEDQYDDEEEIATFISQNIGQCIDINKGSQTDKISYFIQYKNVPNNELFFEHTVINKNYTNVLEMFLEEIIHFSKNKEDLQIYLDVNKYNL